MICKEDVVSWFKELESYKRIDAMCTLLNMCLPFELRFLGTVLEELGRRDSQELRGIELRVNNSTELAADIAACQAGEPTDIKVRRKMAMFLALIRACNRPCVNELFKTLDSWGERDFSKFGDGDPLQELLLVYTMATNHPVFSFEQRMKCGEIFSKINENNKLNTTASTLTNTSTSYQQENTSNIIQQQQQLISNTPPLQTSSQTMPTPHQAQVITTPTAQVRWDLSFPTSQISQIIPADGSLGPHGPIDVTQIQMPVGIPTGIPEYQLPPWEYYPKSIHFIQQSTSPMLSQPSSPVNSRTGSPNRMNPNSHPHPQQQQPQQQQQQQQSQQQPPQQQQIHRNLSQRRVNRRPSVETTPPPSMQNVGSEMIIPQQTVKYEDVQIPQSMLIDSVAQICTRNGYTRNTIPRQSKNSHLHQQNYQTTGNSYNPNNLTCTFHNLNIGDGNQMEMTGNSNRKKSGGSDSGSSIGSLGEISPPETPHLSSTLTNNYQNCKPSINVNRFNGRPEKLPSGTLVYQTGNNSPQQINPGVIQGCNELIFSNVLTSNSSNNSGSSAGGSSSGSNNNYVANNVIMGPPNLVSTTTTGTALVPNPILIPQSPQQFSATYPYHAQQHLVNTTRPPLLAHPTLTPSTSATYRMPQELIYQYNPPPITFMSPTTLRSSPSSIQPQTIGHFPMKLVSCFNCGSSTHTGRECQEASMEDVTRGSIYKLDYNTSSPPQTSNTSSDNSISNDLTQTNSTSNLNK